MESRQLEEPPKPGVYPDVSMEDYHNWNAVSNSWLSRLMKSPAHLQAYIEEEQDETKAMRLGRMIHKAVLEWDEFEDEYVVLGRCEATRGDGERCTYDARYINDGEELCGTHGDEEQHDDSKESVKASEWETAERIRENVYNRQSSHKMLTGSGNVELAVVWKDEETSVTCKMRADRYSPDVPGGALIDLKTTRDAEPREFKRDIFNHGYHRQARFYLRGINHFYDVEEFGFIPVEKSAPYAVGPVYMMDDIDMESVDDQITKMLNLYKSCNKKGGWPAYPDRAEYISIPKWAWKQVDTQTARIDTISQELINDE